MRGWWQRRRRSAELSSSHGGVISSSGTTGMFVFVVIFNIVVSVVLVGSVVGVGGITPDVTPPMLSSPLQVGRIGMNNYCVLHARRR